MHTLQLRFPTTSSLDRHFAQDIGCTIINSTINCKVGMQELVDVGVRTYTGRTALCMRRSHFPSPAVQL